MRKFGFTAMAAGLIGGAMLLSGTAPAAATTLSGSTLAAPGATTMVEQVRRHRGERARQYDSRRHGSRHRQARSGYRYHHGGYYYASPWWLAAPAFGLSIIVPQHSGQTYSGYSHSAHVQWCFNRFRSYNAATDRYLGYDGLYHRCNSPY
jgi:hypothetical protein